MKKALFLLVCLAFIASGAMSMAAEVEGDGKSYELMVSTQLADSHPFCQGFYALAKRVAERTGGKLTVKVFPSAQLGSDEDVIEQAIQGVNVAVVTDAGRMANYVKNIGIVGMAYFADNYDEVMKVQQTNFWKENVKKLAEENGIRVLSFNWFDGARHFLTNKPVKKPEDLKGVRIRTPALPLGHGQWPLSAPPLSPWDGPTCTTPCSRRPSTAARPSIPPATACACTKS